MGCWTEACQSHAGAAHQPPCLAVATAFPDACHFARSMRALDVAQGAASGDCVRACPAPPLPRLTISLTSLRVRPPLPPWSYLLKISSNCDGTSGAKRNAVQVHSTAQSRPRPGQARLFTRSPAPGSFRAQALGAAAAHLLRHKASLCVVGLAVAAVLAAVDVLHLRPGVHISTF